MREYDLIADWYASDRGRTVGVAEALAVAATLPTRSRTVPVSASSGKKELCAVNRISALGETVRGYCNSRCARGSHSPRSVSEGSSRVTAKAGTKLAATATAASTT